MKIGMSLSSSYGVADVREGARHMVECAGAAREASLDSLFVGDAGAFVTEHDRGRQDRGAVHDVVVAGADAGCLDPDEHFAGLRRFLFQLFHAQRLVRLVEDGCLHEMLPSPVSRAAGGRDMISRAGEAAGRRPAGRVSSPSAALQAA